ncbi:MAG: glycoside hydrolase [Opitutae bacterium]|nr:glycoside hydrolase [Opitutae bacterium]
MNRKLAPWITALVCAVNLAAASNPLSLAGEWRFRLDPTDAGEREQWFAQSLPDRIALPGGLTEQGIGNPPSPATPWIGGIQNPRWATDPEFAPYAKPENFKFPYWLTPERYYAGAAWFQRDITVAPEWADKRIVLTLERAHWETRVWVDGKSYGANTALGTPHEYDLGRLAPGKHVLAIRVDNRLIVDVGVDSHSVSDHTQGNWNGIVGQIELHATPLVWVQDLQVFPNAKTRSVRVRGQLGNATGKSVSANVALALTEAGGAVRAATALTANCAETGGVFEVDLQCAADVAQWDEFHPQVYHLTAEVGTGPERNVCRVACGFRELTVDGTQFRINGRKAFFRGTLECAIFPKTGHPPTDIASWERVIRIAKAHGLNMLRFHSWCPPEAAFVAADTLGMYLQIECSSWANHSTSLGDGKPVDAWVYAEADRILHYFGNHPSFVLMLYGNEPGGKNQNAYLTKWVEHYRAQDSRRLYSSGAGWPQIAANEFHVTPDPRIQRWREGLKSRINAQPPETTTDYRAYIGERKVPVISHEIGQWCVYPNFDEIAKYTGYLKAKNFEIFRDLLTAQHMGGQARAFLHASGKLQTLCYKEDIEAALRTPGMGGFQLLDLHDFPGQGTALVGVLDPFWESKGYVTPEEYRRFCNATVPLARLTKRVFTTAEAFSATVEIAHFGAAPLDQAVATWKLVGDDGRTAAHGVLPAKTIPVDNGTQLGSVTADLRNVPAPARYKFVVGLRGTEIENDWDVWVYPAQLAEPKADDILTIDNLDDRALAQLRRGGKVLLLVPPARVKNAEKNPVLLGFSSIFWNTAWTKRQAPTTLGILCDPQHPALAAFPTDTHSNWQWWYLIHNSAAMMLDNLPADFRPTVQVIDDWFTARKLALAFEAQVEGGRLFVCSVDLQGKLDADPVRRQFRASVLRYIASDQFRPTTVVTAEHIRQLMNARHSSP